MSLASDILESISALVESENLNLAMKVYDKNKNEIHSKISEMNDILDDSSLSKIDKINDLKDKLEDLLYNLPGADAKEFFTLSAKSGEPKDVGNFKAQLIKKSSPKLADFLKKASLLP